MAEGQGLIKQPLGLFDPSGFALVRLLQVAMQLVEPFTGSHPCPLQTLSNSAEITMAHGEEDSNMAEGQGFEPWVGY